MKTTIIVMMRIIMVTIDETHQGVQRMMVLVVSCSPVFEIITFCFVGAIFDLVHDVKAIHGLYKLLTASGNLF